MPSYEFSPYSVDGYSNLLLSIICFTGVGDRIQKADPKAQKCFQNIYQKEDH